ncbi:DUF4238 domain-containing protein [Desulfobacter sp.]|uniref:DUF4238 domain-containing protein n=1 Tax=Desulfobacter sp. TaxID=2294 RepID=UPI000E89E33D|nr:DUF4238 domain-containing protein [Desulfobacter sp.]HBT88119.1 hypothetical protein [Desulfobacter sp.]
MSTQLNLQTDVKKQHTVPRFLLNNFGFDGGSKHKRLYTFDKKSERTYPQTVFDATTRNVFYNIEGHPEQASLEPILCIYESEAAPILKKLIETKNLTILTEEERFKIATFVAVQRARSYGELLRMSAMLDVVANKLDSIGATPEQIENELGAVDSSERKNSFLSLILKQESVVGHLLAKSWILYETDEEHPYYISDSPVTLHNSIDMGGYGNLGIGLKGIQIHLPISSTLTIAFTCPSIAEQAMNARDQVLNFKKNAPHFLNILKNPSGLVAYGDAYDKGVTKKQTPENVKFLNSLQVNFGEQYVYCSKQDFVLVEQMLNDNKDCKVGMRYT